MILGFETLTLMLLLLIVLFLQLLCVMPFESLGTDRGMILAR